jgi:hypothetical protein
VTNWQDLTAAQKQAAVREALEVANLTYKRAAERLGTTVGAIAAVVRDSGGAPAGRIRSARTAPPRSNVRRAPVPKAIKEAVAPFGEANATPDARPTYARAWDARPDVTPVAVEDHREGQCKWPVDVGGKTYFCGAPGGKYCAVHYPLGVRAEAPPAKRTTAGKIKAFNL